MHSTTGSKAPFPYPTEPFRRPSCGLGSLLDLADMMHVPAPYITAMVDTASLYMGKPYELFLTVQDLRAIKALRGK